jgi:hypothetical protein
MRVVCHGSGVKRTSGFLWGSATFFRIITGGEIDTTMTWTTVSESWVMERPPRGRMRTKLVHTSTTRWNILFPLSCHRFNRGKYSAPLPSFPHFLLPGLLGPHGSPDHLADAATVSALQPADTFTIQVLPKKKRVEFAKNKKVFHTSALPPDKLPLWALQAFHPINGSQLLIQGSNWIYKFK